jgi:pimeloyl-ACP methyl ester carboxylesterase
MNNNQEAATTPPTSPTADNPTSTRHLDRGEGRIGYDVTGTGPLVIAVPGMGDLRSTYRHLVPALVAAGFRVATMDLRGHGDSDTTFTAYDDRAAASDIVALAEQLGGPALVLGNSMGAGAAVIAAAERPDLVSGLVLIGPFVRDVPVAAWQRLLLRAMMGGPWARRAWLSYLPSLYPTRRDAEFTAHRDDIAAALARPGYRAAFQKTTRTSHAPAEAVLDRVTAPTLVVMGSKDPDFPDQESEARLIADRLHGSFVMIPDAGHYPQAEFPELTTPAVVEFAKRVSSGA